MKLGKPMVDVIPAKAGRFKFCLLRLLPQIRNAKQSKASPSYSLRPFPPFAKHTVIPAKAGIFLAILLALFLGVSQPIFATEVILTPNPVRFGEQLSIVVIADSTVVSASVQIDQNWVVPLSPSQYNLWKTDVFLDPKRMDPNVFRLSVALTHISGQTEIKPLTYYVQSGALLEGGDQTHIQILPGDPIRIAIAAPKVIESVAAGGKLLKQDKDGTWFGKFAAPTSVRFPAQPKVQIKLYKSDGTYIVKEQAYELPNSRLTRADFAAKERIESDVAAILAIIQSPKTQQLATSPEIKTYLTRRNFLLKLRNRYAIAAKITGGDDAATVLRRLDQFLGDLSEGVRAETIALELEGLNLKNFRSDFQVPQSWDDQKLDRELKFVQLKQANSVTQLKLIDAEIAQLEISIATSLAQDRRDRLLAQNQHLKDQNSKSEVDRDHLDAQRVQLENMIEELSDSLKKKIDARKLGGPQARESQ